ncbi:ATP-binding protein [Cysteiniphilum halobium]|uniref:ATP-binding protein n=1 Tax=Cysteiniphilum halobium TaxID=2219059 RepID=UPI003F839924
MKFYNRDEELSLLHEVKQQSLLSAKMTFIVGRRRIGKTKLIRQAFTGNMVYFFVSKKSENLLCSEFVEELKRELKIEIHGEFRRFSDFFAYILELSKEINFTLAIDEFQEFYYVNSAIYSDIQHLWDKHKDESKLNLVLSGSIYSLMHKIFEHSKQPLYGRANRKMMLKGFNIPTLVEIFQDHNALPSPENLLAFYTITGGVAKYVEIFIENQAFSLESILDVFFSHSSLFINEGRDVLIEEFGKEYTTYFSILSLIASSKTSRSEIESILGKSIGGYLEKLEITYNIIQTIKPIFAKPGSRIQKYVINDHFLNFWFRFVYKYQSAIELENYDYIKEIIREDFATYSGRYLEEYMIDILKLKKQYSQIGRYWERGNQNEIDIVAINERNREALIVEVKRAKNKIVLNRLKSKAKNLVQSQLRGYTIHYEGFSLDDMLDYW